MSITIDYPGVASPAFGEAQAHATRSVVFQCLTRVPPDGEWECVWGRRFPSQQGHFDRSPEALRHARAEHPEMVVG